MGRRAKPEAIPVFLSGEPILRLIEDAKNLARWNPVLALKYMEVASLQAENPGIIKQWNIAAASINATIDSIEHQHFYEQEDYWGKQKPTRLEPINSEITLEDWIAIKQFSK